VLFNKDSDKLKRSAFKCPTLHTQTVIGHLKKRLILIILKLNIRTITEFLKKDNIDVTTNKCPLGNQLKADLAIQEVHIDFKKRT
jgi:hypothetical protein